MSTTLRSPFRGPSERDHIIIFRSPRGHFEDLFLKRCPFRGAVDAVMGQLYKKFYDAVVSDPTISTTYDLDNDSHYQRILDRIAFVEPPNPGHSDDVGGGTPSIHPDKSTTSKLPANSAGKNRKRVQSNGRSKTKKVR